MPAAATHDRIALYAGGAMIIPGYLTLRYGLGDTPIAAYNGTMLLVGAHLFGSWWLSPDLDLDGKIDDRWGPLRPLWVPYMRIVPHRHFVSHSGISGIFRLLYLFLVISGVLAILSLIGYLLGADVAYYRDFTDWLWSAFETSARPVWLVVAGVVISDIVHVLADTIDTRRKRGLLHFNILGRGKRRTGRKRYRSHR